MGKIILNGIEYAGTKSSAQQISYNSSDSGLSSTNIQGAIDELASRALDEDVFEAITDEELDAIINTDVSGVSMVYTYDTDMSYNASEEMINVEEV